MYIVYMKVTWTVRGLWLNWKGLHWRHCGSGLSRSGLDREILLPPIPLLAKS